MKSVVFVRIRRILLITILSLLSTGALVTGTYLLAPDLFSPLTKKLFTTNKQPPQTGVLAENTQSKGLLGELSFNIPAIFNDKVTINGKTFIDNATSISGQLSVGDEVTIDGDVLVNNHNLSLGTGELTASNVIYSLTAGDNITITPGQNPIISATATTLQGQSGDLTLLAGSGISIDGLTISSDQNIFSQIDVDGTSFSASGNTDTLSFAAGSGITLSADTSGKEITIAASGGTSTSSQWTTSGSNIYYNTGNVGIGNTSPSTTLDVTGTGRFSSSFTLSSLSTGILHSNSSGLLSSSALNLAGGSSEITGVLPAANGGTGDNTSATTGVPFVVAGDWQYASQLAAARGGTGVDGSSASNGQLLIGNGSGYTLANLTAGSGVSISNGSGSITISASGGAGGSQWTANANGTFYPTNSGLDVILGGTSTASAKFAFINQNAGTPTASVSANSGNNAAFLTGAGNLATTNSQTLTIGGNTTGNITLSPIGGSGTVLSTGNLNLSSGKAFQINGTNVLSSTTLGSSVISSSLTSVGTLTTGTWNASAIGAQYGGTGDDTSGTTGVPYISAGNWQYEAQLSNARGGTGLDTSSASNGQLLIGNGSGLSLATLTAGSGISIANSAGGITISQSGSGASKWNESNGALSPNNNTLDVLIGGSATSSAKFGFLNVNSGTPTASVSAGATGGIYLASDGTIQTTVNKSLTIGGNTTGNITLSPLGGSGTVTSTGNLNLSSGKVYQINGTTVLSNNTLGSGVTASSLTSVGTLTSGTWNATAIGSQYGGTGQNFSASTGVPSISGGTWSVNAQLPLSLGGTNANLTAVNGGIVYSNASGLAISAAGTTGQCLTSGGAGAPTWASCASGTNLWTQANGSIYPINETLDLFVGGTATTSAKFAVLNVNSGTPTASVSAGATGGAYLTAAGTLQTTANQTFTIGGATTGNITLSPLNGSGTVNSTGNLNLSSGKVYQINGTTVLSNNTLGSGVTASSLTSVGTLTSGTWNATAIGAQYGGTGDDTSGTTGVPYISAGNWQYEAALDETRGGTGISTYTTGDMLYGSASNTLSKLAIGSTGQILTVSGGVPVWSNAGGTINFWQRNAGALSPFNITDDLLLGATATTSANFAFMNNAGGTPTASVSGDLTLNSTGNIQTTKNQTLTIGGNSTGTIILSPLNGAGTVFTRGTMNLLSGKTYQIAGSDVLTSTTLGSGIINSSLTSVGTLTSGTWNATAIGAQYGGTGINTSASTGVPSISGGTWSVNSQLPLSLGGTNANLTAVSGGIVYSGGSALAISAAGSTGQCLTSGGTGAPTWATCASGTNLWTQANGSIYPINSTLDLFVGGTATSSAKFAVLNVDSGTPTASVSAGATGGAYLTAAGTLQTTANQTFTIGGATTGNITLSPLNGSGTVNSTGNLNLSSGKVYQINGTTVLSSSALGSGVTGSSLTSVGTLTSGTWNATAIGAQYGGTGDDTSGTTGVPYISAGNWQYEAALDETRGGTGLSTYTTGDMLYGSASNTLSKLAIGGAGQVLTVSGGVPVWSDAGGTINFWQRANGAISPYNITDDLLLGATATTSANFAFMNNAGGTPTASISGNIVLNSAGSLQTTKNQTLTIGGNTTGDITLSPLNGSGTVNSTGNLNLSSGKVYQINGTTVLSNNTLGSGVTASSLTSVGTLTSGTWNATAIGAQYGGTGDNTSATTGVPYISAGNWQYEAQLSAARGGTGVDASAASNGQLLIGNGSGFSLANLTAGSGISISNGSGSITISQTGTGSSKWTQTDANGTLTPNNNTLDLLVGGTATSSAKFGVLNVAGGTPTASLSAGTAGGSYLTAAGTLQTTAKQTLTLGGTTTGNIQLSPNNGSGTLALNVGALTMNGATGATSASPTCVSITNGIVTGTGACGSGAGGSVWTLNSTDGTLYPINNTLDVLFGGTASSSAKFAFKNIAGGTPTASISANSGNNAVFLSGDGNLATTNNQTLTLGGSSTGNISLNPLNGSGTVNSTGNLNLSSGKVYQINGTTVLSNNTLGSGVTASSLTSVGTLTSGTWNATAIGAQYGGTGDDTSGTTGVPYISAGNWQYEAQLSAARGGTGVNGSSASNGQLLIGNGSGFSLANLTAGSGISISNGAGSITISQTSGGGSKWTQSDANGVLSPNNNTLDLLVGGTATSSAKFAVLNVAGGTPTASVSAGATGGIYLAADGTIQSTLNKTLTIGGNSTGNITLSPLNGSGTVTSTGNLNLSSGKVYQINGTTVLSSSTLGSGVTASSLTSVGTLTSGTWNATAIGAQYGGTGDDTSGTTGVPYISAGNWQYEAALDETRGGTGISTYTTGDMLYGSASNTLSKLAIGSTGQILTVSGGVPVWSDAGGTINFWQRNAGAVIPLNITDDLLLGATATSSAKIAFTNVAGGTPTASISANSGNNATFITGAGNLATTNNQTLTIGGTSTGNITLNPLNGSGIVNATGDLNLSSGKVFQINGTTVLSSGTLGSGVTASSLTSVGTLTSGTWNATAIGAQYGGTGINTSASTGVPSISSGTWSVNAQLPLSLGGTNANLTAVNGGIVYSGASALAISAAGSTGQCLLSGGAGAPTWSNCTTGGGTNWWNQANGTVYPINSTVDLLVGGQASTSAKFAVLNVNSGTPTASVSAGATGGAYITAAGTLQTTANQTLTLGGNTTGDITLSPLNGSGTVTSTGNLNLSSGKVYQINGTNVLSATTLGSGVTGSSLTSVGTIATGTWQATAIGAQYGGTGDDTSGTTGVPYISAGNWQYEAALDETRGGTGISTYTTGDMLYGSASNTLSKLAIGSTGQILTVSGGVPVWSDAGGTINFWQRNAGAVSPLNITDDLLLGATATTSAKFAFKNVAGGTPTASISANSGNNATFITGDGNLATTNSQTLTIGGSSTGDITLSPIGGSGAVTSTGNLNLSSGKVYQINGTTVLSSGTLGSGVTASSLTSVGTLTSGTWNATAIGAQYGGTGINTSASTGVPSISSGTWSVNAQLPLSLGGTNANLTAVNGGIVYSGASALAISAAGSSGQCLLSGGAGAPTWGACTTGGGTNWWNLSSGALYPINSTADLLIGGQASTSAKFAVLNVNSGTPTASVSAGAAGAAYLSADGNIQTTAQQTLTLGGNTTGNITLSPRNGSGTVLSTGDLNLSSGKVFQINGTSVLSSSTLGSGVTASSLTSVGTLTSGTWNATAIGAQYGGTGDDTSGTTGVPYISAGNWQYEAQLSAARGGTGVNGSSASNGQLLIGNGSGFSLANLTAGSGISITNGSGSITIAQTGSGSSKWTQTDANGTLTPNNNTLDVLIGGTATSSAKFGVLNVAGGTPTASLSAGATGGAYLTAAGTLQTTVNQTLTLGGNTTGNITLSPLNGSGTVLSTGNLNLSSGKTFQINGTDVLSNNTLGSGVTASSLTSVGTLTSGTWNATAIGSQYGGTGQNFSASTGVPSISSGTWSVNAQLPLSLGGTNANLTAVNGGIVYSGASALAISAAGSTGQCLLSGGAGAPTWGTCATGTNLWNQTNGTIYPSNSTVDLLIGGQASTSAKFAVLNVNSGTPTASLSAGSAGGAYITAAGTLQTTANQTLTLGGNTTGNIILNPLNGSGYVGIGKTNPGYALDVTGAVNTTGTAASLRLNAQDLGGNTAILYSASGELTSYVGLNIRQVLTASGRLGLGLNNSTPLATLDVQGTSTNGGTVPIASFSGTTSMSGLLVDQSGVGDIFTASKSGATKLTLTNAGNLNLSSVNAYHIGGTSVLSSSTLGSGVTASSLTSVGTLTSGTWNATAIGSQYGGTGQNFSASTGVPSISSGTWSVNAQLPLSLGGTNANLTAVNGGIVYSGASALAISAAGSSGQCLLSGGAGAPTWGSCTTGGGTNWWNLSSGALYPINSTADLLIGGQASTSAKFAVLNVNSGTPTASLSAGTAGGAYITAAGTLATTARQTLALGDNATTGNISLNAGSGVGEIASTFGLFGNFTVTQALVGERFRIDANGRVGINASSPLGTLDLRTTSGTLPIATISGQTSFAALMVDQSGVGDIFTASKSGKTHFAIKNSGNVGIGTAVPGARLTVTGEGSGDVRIGSTGFGGNYAGISLNGTLDTGSYNFLSSTSDTNLYINRPTGSDIVFRANNSTQAVISSGGSMIVGGTTPEEKLDVIGNFKVRDAATETKAYRFRTDGSNLDLEAGGAHLYISNWSGADFTGTQYNYLVLESGANIARAVGTWQWRTSAEGTSRHIIDGTTGANVTFNDNAEATDLTIEGDTDSSLFIADGSADRVGIGVATPLAKLDIRGGTGTGANNGTVPVASVSGQTAAAAMVVDQSGLGDVFTASKSGKSFFTVKNNGVIQMGNSTNGLSFDYINGGPTYSGSARPTKQIVLSPEYNGAVLTASGSSTTNGQMTSDASPSANFRTYYNWTSSQTTLQDYQVAVRVTLPADFSSWAPGGSAMQVNFNTALTTADTNRLDVLVYNPSSSASVPVVYKQQQKSATVKTWTTVNISATELSGSTAWNTASHSATIYLKMYAKDNNYVQIGDIILNYLSKF